MKLNALILAAALMGAGAAYAQGGPATPDVQAGRDAMMKACAADTASLCAGKTGPEAGQCMRDAGDKVSAGCRDAMSRTVRPAAGGPGAGPGPRAAAPPPAATPIGAGGTWTLDVREDWLVGRVHRAQEEHDVDDGEAERVYKEVASMRALAKAISERRGRTLTAGEMNAQQGRLDTLIASIHWLHDNAFQRPW